MNQIDLERNVVEIKTTVAGIKAKQDMMYDLLKEHKSSHSKYNLMGWSAIVAAVAAVFRSFFA